MLLVLSAVLAVSWGMAPPADVDAPPSDVTPAVEEAAQEPADVVAEEPGIEQETEPEQEAETEPESEPDAEAEPEPEAGAEAEEEPEAEEESEAEEEPKAEEEPEAEPEPDATAEQADRDLGSLGSLSEPGTVQLEETEDIEGVGETVELPGRLGPANITLDERGDRLTLGLATQFLLRGRREIGGAGQAANTDVGVEISRLRLVFGSYFLEGKVRSSVQLNLAPNAPELIDIWVLYAPLRKLALRFGQFKTPYSRYRSQSFAALSMTDWSPVTRVFGGERQLGVELLNPEPDRVPWEYGFGVFTGQNARSSHGLGVIEAYGEDPINPSDFRTLTPAARIHPELVGRVARNVGPIDTSTNSDARRGPLRYSIGLSGGGDLRPRPRQDLEGRLGLEWLAKVQGVHINAAGHMGWFDTGERSVFGVVGAHAETGYRFDRHWEVAARFSHVHFSQALLDDARVYAADQIGDGSDTELVARYSDVGNVDFLEEGVLTGSFYVIGNSLKGQLEAAWSGGHTPVGWRHRLIGRLQLQLQF